MKRIMLGALALLVGGVTYAQNNESKVEQMGDKSLTTVYQEGRDNNSSTYTNGVNNDIDIRQLNRENQVRVESRNTGSVAGSTNDNFVKVLQNGRNNYSSVAVWGGEDNEVSIRQLGNDNNRGDAHAQFFGVPRTVQIEGTRNNVDVLQDGNRNDGTVAIMEGAFRNGVDVDQIGAENVSGVEVIGAQAGNNQVMVRQNGNENTSAVSVNDAQRGMVDVFQSGTGHTSSVTQQSSPWSLSDKNTATVRQFNSNQISTVIQQGTNNNALVRQKN